MGNGILQLRSLKTRVTLSTLAIFVVSISLTSFYVRHMLREEMQSMLGEQQLSTVSIIAGDIDQSLSTRVSALENVAKKMTPAMFANPPTLQATLDDRPALETLFNGGYFVVRFDGLVIADFPLSTGRRGLNFSDRPFIAQALQGKAAISKPFKGLVTPDPIFVMTVPIFDGQGKVLGALGGIINLGKPNFLDKMTSGSYGQFGDYLLVAPQYHLVITATEKSHILEPLPVSGKSALIDRFIHGYEGSGVMLNSKDEEVLISAKRIPTAGWYLAATIPTARAFTPIKSMQQRMKMMLILVILFVGGMMWWIIKRQLTPMLDAAKTLATLADSTQTPQPLPIARQDEVGDLIGGFNRLLRVLAQREDMLRQSQEKFSTLFTSMTEMVVLHELEFNAQGEAINYRIIDCNNAFTAMTGIRKEDAIGRLATEVYATESAPHFDEFYRVAQTGVPYEFLSHNEQLERYFSTSVVSPKKDSYCSGLKIRHTPIDQVDDGVHHADRLLS
jgi:PAS domain-containing protein